MKNDVVAGIRAFNRFYTSIIGVTSHHILESGYSLTEVRVLYEIYHFPGITARQLTVLVNINEGYLSRLIGKLVKQKLISKIKSGADNRVYSLALSKKGASIFLALDQRSSVAVAAIIRHLGKTKQAELVALLDRVKNLLTDNKTGNGY